MKTFLLNPDGSFPATADIVALKKAGVVFVVPTPRPRPPAGKALLEGEPEQDAEGVWRQVWLEVEAPPEPPPSVPESVTRFQARAVLLQMGLLAQVNAIVAQADELTQLAYAETINWERNSPMLKALAGALSLTDEQVDDMFRQAAEIKA